MSPDIYVTKPDSDWWKTRCTRNSAAFGTTNPLWIAHYLLLVRQRRAPAGREGLVLHSDFWQYADKAYGSLGPGDQDEFNGTLEGLTKCVGLSYCLSGNSFPHPESGTAILSHRIALGWALT